MSQPIPSHYQAAINVALSQNLPEFYIEGGCGVMAALLAEAACFKRVGGEFNLIIRTDNDRPYVSHITFIPNDEDLDLDVDGDNAEDEWIDFILEEVASNGGIANEVEFDNLSVSVSPGDDIQSILIELTEDHDLAVDCDWVEENYPKLKMLLKDSLIALAA